MVLKTDWQDNVGNIVDATYLNALDTAVNAAYVKPGTGIPSSDMEWAVQQLLSKANTALQSVAANSITNTEMADDAIGIAELSATGTPSTTTYLRGDNTWTSPPGSGDASTNTSTSVDSEVAVFSGTTGKIIKRATGSGLAKLTSGVLSAGSAGTDYVAPGGALGTPSSGTLTNCSGLPVSGVTASISTALGVGSIELGHASDTTLTRTSAGVVAVEGTALLKSGGALGTPSGGTLTNCSSLPVSGITASTSTALGVGSIELGHATDTTISRVSAGVVAIEGSNIVKETGLADVPRYLVWTGSAWPDRPADTRPAIFVGGSAATNVPADADLRSGDVWIPATA